MAQILVTGSEGLVGTALCGTLEAEGHEVVQFDLKRSAYGHAPEDVRDRDRVAVAVNGCAGIIHLAAVSRVVHGERDPIKCRQINVEGTRNVLSAAASAPSRPWVMFASSREVYGEPEELPVAEDAPLRPVNVYGRSKAEGERWVQAARDQGVATAIVRFSNVYGSTQDHSDRVVPAFARAATTGEPMRVDGGDHTFDFIHLSDTVRGVVAVVEMLEAGERRLPPIHLLTGQGTTLRALAQIAKQAGGNRSLVYEAPERIYDVARFIGDPTRSRDLLGWSAKIAVQEGVAALVIDFKAGVGPELTRLELATSR